MRDKWELQSMQAAPLSVKISMTKQRIREWVDAFGEDHVYVSFSGGKDSTVLLRIAREEFPNMKAVFVDTGLEYPEIRQFVKTFDNVDWVKPKKTFKQVTQDYGFPFISKEVAECVQGARKYMAQLAENGLLNDNEADEQAQKLRYRYSYDKLTGSGKYAKPVTKGGEISLEKLQSIVGSRPQGEGQRMRLARMLGTLDKDGKVLSSIPSGNRSAYAQTRYQFFLEAPFEISHMCCNVMKKAPAHSYERRHKSHAMTAQMASESRLRTQKWLQHGCNGFDLQHPISNPMAFWTEQDVLAYIYEYKIPIASVYGEVVMEGEGQMSLPDLELFEKDRPVFHTTGCNRTGCIFCAFGAHLEEESRFQRLKETHPAAYRVLFTPEEEGGYGYKEKIDWINEHGGFNIQY